MNDDSQDSTELAPDTAEVSGEPVAQPEAAAAPSEAPAVEAAPAPEEAAPVVSAPVPEPAAEPAAPIVQKRVGILFPHGISDRLLRDIVQLCNIKCVAIEVRKEGEE